MRDNEPQIPNTSEVQRPPQSLTVESSINTQESNLNSLATKLTVIKNRVQASREKIQSLVTDPPVDPDQTEKKPERYEVVTKLSTLCNEEVSAVDFMQQSRQILPYADDLIAEAKADINRLDQQKRGIEHHLKKYEDEYHDLCQAKGLRKITTYFRKKEANNLVVETAQKLNRQIDFMEPRQNDLGKLERQVFSIRQKQEETLKTETKQAIDSVVEAYVDFNKAVSQDGTVHTDIRHQFLKESIIPSIKTCGISDGAKEELYNNLVDYVNCNSSESIKKEDLKTKITQQLSKNSLFDLQIDCNQLFNNIDADIPTEIISRMAAEDITSIQEITKGIVKSSTEAQMIEYYSLPHNRLEKRICSRVTNPVESFPEPKIWSAVKNSQPLHEVFGGFAKKMDESNYQHLISAVLHETTGSCIDALYYYPTPETIKTLVVLAAADSGPQYSTNHANRTLSELKIRSPNWSGILDQTETVYPEIKPLRDSLEKWSQWEHTHEPDVQKKGKELFLKIINDPKSSKELVDISISALPTKALIDLLAVKNITSCDNVEVIKKALEILENPPREVVNELIANNQPLNQVDSNTISKSLRNFSISTLKEAFAGNIDQNSDFLKKCVLISDFVINNSLDTNALKFISSLSVQERIIHPKFKSEDFNHFMSSYKEIPALLTNYDLLYRFCACYSPNIDLASFESIYDAYKDHKNIIGLVVDFVKDKKISPERAIEIATNDMDIFSPETLPIVIDFPNKFLSPKGCNNLRELSSVFAGNTKILLELAKIHTESNHELITAMPKLAPVLSTEAMKGNRDLIIKNFDTIVKENADIKFINNLIGKFGKKSDQLLIGYLECLNAGAITTKDRELALEFAQQFRVFSPITLEGYRKAKEVGSEKIYVSQLQALAEKMTGIGTITDEERKRPYYKDLIHHVYANNAGGFGSYEGSASCSDRSADIAGFKIDLVYEIDLLSQSEIKTKDGETLDLNIKEQIQKPIYDIAAKINNLGHNKEKVQAMLRQDIDQAFNAIVSGRGFDGVDLEKITTNDEKLFLILVDSVYGGKSINNKVIKDLFLTYEFANYEDVSEYINGTNDRTRRASNQDYALFCEVEAFYSDRIKEVNRRLVDSAWNNPVIATQMLKYFDSLSRDSQSAQKKDAQNKIQIEKLGLSRGFIDQVGSQLKRRYGSNYSPEQIIKFIHSYENLNDGLSDKKTTSDKKETQAVYGLIRAQREKTFEALRILTGRSVDPAKTHLEEINLEEAMKDVKIVSGEYNDEQFATYTGQKFIDIFQEERQTIHHELDKFESSTGKKREVLNGTFSKNKETAHARMVGGVCVSQDNPSKNPKQNLWDMKNYLEFVLQEPDTLQCQGLVLLHHFTENGKKVLTASFNPSGTYVYSVDEEALFNGLASKIEQFAQDNNFDIVAVSKHKAVRTNRTNGTFEAAMDKRIKQVNKSFSFSKPQQFSYSPAYEIQDMDIIWEKKAA